MDVHVIVEIENFLRRFPSLCDNYLPVSKIGEGTFSTVYKAIDLNHGRYENGHWFKYNLDDNDYAGCRHAPERLTGIDLDMKDQDDCPNEASLREVSPNIAEILRFESFVNNPELYQLADDTSLLNLAENTFIWRSKMKKIIRFLKENTGERVVFVAIKRINPTSSPDRIFDEISFVKKLEGLANIICIVNVVRVEDQIVVATPYFKHLDFREYFQKMTISDIQHYMFNLFTAVQHVHAKSIIHRDLKPSNFLYSISHKRGLLVDFGLAQKYSPLSNPYKKDLKASVALKYLKLKKQPSCPGYYANDPRPPFKAPRAGTRGFRAPEVLFKYPHQTYLIDIWSIGVILLTILTGHYPFFNSPDDIDAIVEIACIFGNKAMSEAAAFYQRRWTCNIPTVPSDCIPMRKLVARFNPSLASILPESAYDLLEKCLALKTESRISAKQALEHSFFDDINRSLTTAPNK